MRVAKQRANRENGRKGGLVKSLKKRIAARRNARVRVLVAARNHRNRDCVDPRALRTASNRPQAMGESDIPNPTFGSGSGSVQDLSARRQKGHQLSFLCVCGKKPIELKTLGCCRRCYDRGYTLRGFRWYARAGAGARSLPLPGVWRAVTSAGSSSRPEQRTEFPRHCMYPLPYPDTSLLGRKVLALRYAVETVARATSA